MLWKDITYALRMMRRTPLFTAAVILNRYACHRRQHHHLQCRECGDAAAAPVPRSQPARAGRGKE